MLTAKADVLYVAQDSKEGVHGANIKKQLIDGILFYGGAWHPTITRPEYKEMLDAMDVSISSGGGSSTTLYISLDWNGGLGRNDVGPLCLVAALWLVGNVGTIEPKSNDGRGSIVLTEWSWPEWNDFVAQLPMPHKAMSGDGWGADVAQGLSALSRWRRKYLCARVDEWRPTALLTADAVVVAQPTKDESVVGAYLASQSMYQEALRSASSKYASPMDGRALFEVPIDGRSACHYLGISSRDTSDGLFSIARSFSYFSTPSGGKRFGVVWTLFGGMRLGRDIPILSVREDGTSLVWGGRHGSATGSFDDLPQAFIARLPGVHWRDTTGRRRG